MNRCFQSPTALLIGAMLVSMAGLAASPLAAQTLLRQFPAAALRGTLEVTAPPDILINGQSARLSPGARIKDVSNTLVMSGSLVGQELLVNYLRDRQGLIHEVWILNAQEAQEKRSGQDRTNIVFESDADQPAGQDGNKPFHPLPRLPTR